MQDLYYTLPGAEGAPSRQAMHEVWLGDVGPLAFDVVSAPHIVSQAQAGQATTHVDIAVRLPSLLDIAAAARRIKSPELAQSASAGQHHGSVDHVEEHQHQQHDDGAPLPPPPAPLDAGAEELSHADGMEHQSSSPAGKLVAPYASTQAQQQDSSQQDIAPLPLIFVRGFDGMVYPTATSVYIDAPRGGVPSASLAEDSNWWKLRIT
jgi:hypothetical protein